MARLGARARRPTSTARLLPLLCAPWLVALLGACGDGTPTETGVGGVGGSAGAGASSGGSSGSGVGGAAGSTPDGGSGGSISVEGCPPEGPFGTAQGEVAPDVTLLDCEGNEHHLHDLCPRQGAYLYTWAAWCSSCQQNAQSGTHNVLWSAYQGDDFDLWFVVTGTTSLQEPPDAAYCALVRELYQLNMPVLYDPTGVTQSMLQLQPNSASLVMSQHDVIELTGPWALPIVEDELQSIFGH